MGIQHVEHLVGKLNYEPSWLSNLGLCVDIRFASRPIFPSLFFRHIPKSLAPLVQQY
jgi:hypothetical protein